MGFVARIKDGLKNVTCNDIGPINDQEMDALSLHRLFFIPCSLFPVNIRNNNSNKNKFHISLWYGGEVRHAYLYFLGYLFSLQDLFQYNIIPCSKRKMARIIKWLSK